MAKEKAELLRKTEDLVLIEVLATNDESKQLALEAQALVEASEQWATNAPVYHEWKKYTNREPGWVHNKLMVEDEGYKDLQTAINVARKNLYGPLMDGLEHKPHENSAIAVQLRMMEEQRQDYLLRKTDEFNAGMEKKLKEFPADFLELIQDSDSQWDKERN